MAPPNVSLKLMIDKRGNRVLFAEAGKDFVDFLFNLLSLPIGTVVRLLDKDDMVGCFAKLYQSIKDLNNDYIQSSQQKKELLEIKSSISFVSPEHSLLPLDALSSPPATKTFSTPSYSSSIGWTLTSASAPALSSAPIFATNSLASTLAPIAKSGFVKGVVTYMVMDDLVVTPMSTISSITLLNKVNIKEIDALEEKVVHIGMDQGLEILKNALASNTVLTNVFLGEVGNARN